MKLSRDIQSLSVFKRDSAKFIKQLKKTGEPMVLTVNGRAAAVVMDPERYEKFLIEKEYNETIAAIRRGLADVRAGRVTDADVFFEEFVKKHGIPTE